MFSFTLGKWLAIPGRFRIVQEKRPFIQPYWQRTMSSLLLGPSSCLSGVAGTLCEQHHLGYLRPIRCPICFFETKITILNEGDWRSSCLEEGVFEDCKIPIREIMNIEIIEIMEWWFSVYHLSFFHVFSFPGPGSIESGEKRESTGLETAWTAWLPTPGWSLTAKCPLKSDQNPIGSRIVFRKHHFFEGLLLLNYRGVWLKTSTHYNYGPCKF